MILPVTRKTEATWRERTVRPRLVLDAAWIKARYAEWRHHMVNCAEDRKDAGAVSVTFRDAFVC